MVTASTVPSPTEALNWSVVVCVGDRNWRRNGAIGQKEHHARRPLFPVGYRAEYNYYIVTRLVHFVDTTVNNGYQH